MWHSPCLFLRFFRCFGLKHIFWLGDDFEVARSAVFPIFFDSRYCYIHGFLRAAIEVAAVFLSDFLTDIFESAFVLLFEWFFQEEFVILTLNFGHECRERPVFETRGWASALLRRSDIVTFLICVWGGVLIKLTNVQRFLKVVYHEETFCTSLLPPRPAKCFLKIFLHVMPA